MRIGDISPYDKRFWKDKPDPGFNPEHNRRVIDESIKKYEARRAKAQKTFVGELKERTDAVTAYLTGPYGAHRGRSVERYFGRRYLAKLRGQEIVNQIRTQRNSTLDNLRRMVAKGKGFRVELDRKNGEKKAKSKTNV